MTLAPDISATKTELLKERYGNLFNLDAPWNRTLSELLSHRSIRAYLSKSLPSGTLELLVAAAQSAATSSNLQTWSVVAVEDQARKERLSQLAGGQAHIRQSPLFLVWLADLARPTHIAESRDLPHEGLSYLETFLTAAIDASLAAQNAVVAAESLGLGTAYIGGIRNNPEEVAAELNLPKNVFAVFGLCVGYADPAQSTAIKPRLPQKAVLHREHYRIDAQDDAIEQYNQVMKDFYTEQKMNVAGDWTQHSSDRIATPESLRNRANLRQILNNLGFELR